MVRLFPTKFAGLSLLALTFATVTLTACTMSSSDGEPGADPGPSASPDVVFDACAAIPASSEPYEQEENSGAVGDRLEDFTLDDCDGNAWRLADAVRSAELTLVNVGAGWCRPCREESAELEERIHAAFCSRGLRVVQILYQDENVSPATPTFCRNWTDEFGLEFPVLTDPFFTRSVWFEDELAQTPLNLLVDKEGHVVERFVGDSGLQVLIDAIEAHLPPE